VNVFALAFLIVGLILLILASLGLPGGRFSLLAAGLAFWCLAEIVTRTM
jgi:hypothetical protein